MNVAKVIWGFIAGLIGAVLLFFRGAFGGDRGMGDAGSEGSGSRDAERGREATGDGMGAIAEGLREAADLGRELAESRERIEGFLGKLRDRIGEKGPGDQSADEGGETKPD